MNSIHELLNTIPVPDEGLILKRKQMLFWGRSSSGGVVFGIESRNKNLVTMTQKTKYLKIFLNTEFVVSCEDRSERKRLSLILLSHDGMRYLDVFIRILGSVDCEVSDREMLSYFLSLKDLFANDTRKSISELQGLYGELFVMVYLKEKFNIDVSPYYQSEERRKFDFSIGESKKIEVKTTTAPNRVHRFKLDQLNVLRYDILVASLMLQKDDRGLDLYSLIDHCVQLFRHNFRLVIHIENMIRNIDKDVLESLRFNTKFSEDNIAFLKAMDIPRIQERTVDGVFNVEFESDLSTSKSISPNELREWLRE